MKYARIATLSLLPFSLLASACPDDDGGVVADKVPMQGEWETVINGAIIVHDAELAEQIGIAPVTNISIGKLAGDNLVNRGDVEVVYAEDHIGVVDGQPGNGPKITVEIRKFTTAEDESARDENLAKTALYAYTQSPGDTAPTEDMAASWCVQELDFGNGPLELWSESCYLTVWYDGLSQPLRDGADIRITVPADWQGKLFIETSDNIQDAVSYPRRSNVTITDLAGEADDSLESGEAKVRLSDAYLEVLNCDQAGHDACRDARWNTQDYGACIDADGVDDDGHCESSEDCAGDSECMVNNCYCNADDFKAVRVESQDLKPANITVDLPGHLWTAVQAQNNEPDLAPDSDPLCEATVECDTFDACEVDEDNSANAWKQYVELNDLGDDNIEGLGIQLNVQSDACANVPIARVPDDLDNPTSEKRGDLRVCNGCLDDL